MLRTAARSLLQASGSLPNAAVAQQYLTAPVVQVSGPVLAVCAGSSA